MRRGPAQYFRHRLTPVPVNCALYDRTNKRPSDAPTPTYREPLEPRTAILYDGFLAQSTATISMGPKDVQRLLANEEAELMAAHGAGRCDPDAAPPRSVALTVLIKNSQEEPSRTHLLDSMALLAHDGGPARAATVARFAVLADRGRGAVQLRPWRGVHGRGARAGARVRGRGGRAATRSSAW